MKHKTKAPKPKPDFRPDPEPEPDPGPDLALHTEGRSDARIDHLCEVIATLTTALSNCRRFMQNTKMNINYSGIDTAIESGVAALKAHKGASEGSEET